MQENSKKLPIEQFKQDILNSESQYIIVEAETGSGKSTMVPQWYRELGMKVLVTEPLIETVIGTSEYVAQLAGVTFGKEVGYRTGSSRQDCPSTEILFCTDGLALVREMAGHNRFDVLVIDELHEWNKNQSTLEAWAWKKIADGTSLFKKIIVLSATIDSKELSAKRGNAPVFKVPGRQFPIVDRPAGESIEADIRTLVAEGHDVMVFQPGKKEINKTIEDLKGLDAELIPFHGQVERSEKNMAYRSYDRPKVVVCTNALETGRTLLPSLIASDRRTLAVVDSGMERRIEIVDGIEGLYLKPIALARGKQRRGRTGRVGDGIYIDHCPTSTDMRSAYPIPEILRTRIDQTVLRLAVAGYDATELPFFHDLEDGTLDSAKKALFALGALNKDGSVTKVGRTMAKMPTSVQFARMVIEANKLGVVNDILDLAGILEQGGINDRTGVWKEKVTETDSDLLAQLELWRLAKNLSGEQFKKNGIFKSTYFRAKEMRVKLAKSLGQEFKFSSSGNRNDILKAAVAGMVDHLYKERYGSYENGDYSSRELAKESVVSGGDWIVGLPKDISFKNRRGNMMTLNLVHMVTKIDPVWLTEVAPHLSEIETGLNAYYNADDDTVKSTTKTIFNGQEVDQAVVVDANHTDASELFLNWVAGEMVL